MAQTSAPLSQRRATREWQQLKTRIAFLESENAELRKSLSLEPTSEDTWAAHAPQHLRDQAAANALIAEKLDEMRAMIRLGFNPDRNGPTGKGFMTDEYKAIARRIFGTPGVQAILATDMTDANENKAAIIQSLVQKARGDGPDSVRAAQQLAKMADWNEGDKNVAAAGANNFMLMFGGNAPALSTNGNGAAHAALADPDRTIDATEFLVHEPSAEGEKIIDEDTEAAKE